MMGNLREMVVLVTNVYINNAIASYRIYMLW